MMLMIVSQGLRVSNGVRCLYTNAASSIINSVAITKCADTLTVFHDGSQLSWCILLPSLAITARMAIGMPLTIAAHKAAWRRQAASKELSRVIRPRLVSDISRIHTTLDDEGKRRLLNKEVKRAWRSLVVRDKCSLTKMALPVVTQMCVWLTMSFAIRRLCLTNPDDLVHRLTNVEMANEGCLWFTNLMLPDTTFILATLASTIMIVNSEIPETRKTPFTLHPKLFKVVKRGSQLFVVSLVPLSSMLPSAMPLYWLASATSALMATLTLMSPTLRRSLGIPTDPDMMIQPYRKLIANALKRAKRPISLFKW